MIKTSHTLLPWPIVALLVTAKRGDQDAGEHGAGSEAHITPDEEYQEDHILDEKIPQGGQENPIHTSSEYVNGRADVNEVKKDEKADTPV